MKKREPALPSCTGCHGSHRVARVRLPHALADTSPEQTGVSSSVTYDGFEGPGQGKHIVFVTGDEEYRSEESMPQLAKILTVRHGFKCTVLFAINRETGEIDPQTVDNIPGLEALATADLMVLFLRFRELPDDRMQRIIDYTNSGRPIVALRTATHSFNYVKHPDNPYAKWSFRATGEYEGGYGRQVLGETWISHYGHHQQESTRGLIAEGMKGHPIVRGCEDIWGPSDVYAITTLSGDSRPLILGQVLTGMNQDDPPNNDKPPVPVAWTKTYTGAEGKTSRVFTTTMGHGGDLQSEGFRRLLANACYWALGMEDAIPERSNVDLVGEYDPNPIGFGGHKRGLRPEDHALGR
ncbi:MAG: ThuA domain-containing protein [Armatimonadetes bacterium]|nr:ThuA domain-containing protein [Armatimonadota bacterium]